MALPKIETAKFNISVPVLKDKIVIRPYLVGEENAFLTALNSKKQDDAILSFIDLCKKCVVKGLEVGEDTPIAIFFYLLLMLRCKSKGEIVEVTRKCSNEECKQTIPIEIDLEKCIVWNNVDKKKIFVEVSDTLGVELVPTRLNFIMSSADKAKSQHETVVWSLANSIDKVMYKDQVYSDFTVEELSTEILDKLTYKQLEKIAEKLAELPYICIKVKIVCPTCGCEEEIEVKDILDFFI